jgi:sugar phosphate isomerase/epimerase
MRISEDPPLHLTYCLNIHRGESWQENFDAIRNYACRVRDLVSPNAPFGLGMRLSHAAAATLGEDAALAAFRDVLESERMYVFTVNGFPYGKFHDGPVKEKVYQPDWRTSARRDYTNRLADILSKLLPEGKEGSISTVPCSFKPWILRSSDIDRIVRHLADCAAHLVQLTEQTGTEIHLGLEPEPGCYLETTEEAVRFFTEHLFVEGVRYLKQRIGRTGPEAEALMRKHVGVCFDTCHVAIQFEELEDALTAYQTEGIRISKIQLSAALEVINERSRIEALHPFVEPVYLHQVKGMTRHGSLRSWNDLPDALRDVKDRAEVERLRIHFHVPLCWDGSTRVGTTGSLLSPAFFDRLREGVSSHLEIETYTFDVLPDALQCGDVVESIVREYAWAMSRLKA